MAIETDADLEATTYATVADADAVAERRGVAAWSELSDDQKVAALESATLNIDTLDWIGTRASAEQMLEWPRTGTDYSEDAWPTRLVNAVIELAFSYAPAIIADETVDPLAPPDTSTLNLKRKKIGPIEKEWFAPAVSTADLVTIARFPSLVQNLLRPLIRVATSGLWGTGEVIRAS